MYKREENRRNLFGVSYEINLSADYVMSQDLCLKLFISLSGNLKLELFSYIIFPIYSNSFSNIFKSTNWIWFGVRRNDTRYLGNERCTSTTEKIKKPKEYTLYTYICTFWVLKISLSRSRPRCTLEYACIQRVLRVQRRGMSLCCYQARMEI